MNWSVTTPSTGTVLTWAQLKAHIRPGSVSEQAYIMDLLASATAYAETMLQQCLLPQTITATYDVEDIGWHPWSDVFSGVRSIGWRDRALVLPRNPVIAIDSVSDCNGQPVEYSTHTAGNAVMIVPDTGVILYTLAPITVVYQAGHNVNYGDAIPADILQAIKVHVATAYMVREEITNLPANNVHKLDAFYRFRGAAPWIA